MSANKSNVVLAPPVMKTVTVPDLLANPIKAIEGGIALAGIPNSDMVQHASRWTVVAYVPGEDTPRSTQPLTEWIEENGEPNATK